MICLNHENSSNSIGVSFVNMNKIERYGAIICLRKKI